MTDTVTFRDRTYGADDLLTALISFSSLDDGAGATDFLIALPAELKPKGAEALGEIVARGTPDQVAFAASQLGYVDGIPMEDLLFALKRDDLSRDARFCVGSQIEREVLGRGAAYDPWLRTLVGREELTSGLAPVFLIRDRAWALERLDLVLAGKALEVSMGVRGALARLDPDGQRVLAAELRAKADALPQAARDELERTFGYFGL